MSAKFSRPVMKHKFFEGVALKSIVVLALLALVGAAPASDESVDAALAKAAAAKVGEAEFQEAIRSVATKFSEAEAATEPGKAEWNKLTLNARGKKVDAIRVRTPAGDKLDLVWAFSLPASLDRWYILPVEGSMQGFKNFWKVKGAELFGPDAATDASGVVQMLSAKQLEPDKEYLIWFTFKDEKPAEMAVMMAFLPPGKSGSVKAASKSLGLPKPAPADTDAK